MLWGHERDAMWSHVGTMWTPRGPLSSQVQNTLSAYKDQKSDRRDFELPSQAKAYSAPTCV